MPGHGMPAPHRRPNRRQDVLIEASFVRCGRGLNQQDRRFRGAQLGVVLRWIFARHPLGDHRLADARASIDHQPRHPALLRHFHQGRQSVEDDGGTVERNPMIAADTVNSFVWGH